MSKQLKVIIQEMIDTAPSQWVSMFKHHKLGKKPKVDVLIDKVLEKTPSGASSGERGEAKHSVPKRVRQEAFEGLLLAHKHNWSSKSGIGLVRAMQLVLEPKIWDRSINRMDAYFTRHRNDKNSASIKSGKQTWGPEKPSRGYIAHLAWGGDSGQKWASKQVKKTNPRSRTGPIIGRDWNQEFVRTSPEIAEARRLLVERPVDRKGPEFKAWFQDSVVKSGSRGVPTIVYRGTADIRNFLKTGTFRGGSRYLGPEAADKAYFFTDKYSIAKTYATDKSALDYRSAIPAVAGFYLRIQNPLIVDAEGQSFRATEHFIREAYNAGYDGLIVKNTLDAYNVGTVTSTVYVVWSMKNVKLADGREGPYGDTEDTRINPKRRQRVSKRTLTNPETDPLMLKAIAFVQEQLPELTEEQTIEYAKYLLRTQHLDVLKGLLSEALSRIQNGPTRWNGSDIRIDMDFDTNSWTFDVDVTTRVYVGDTYFTVFLHEDNIPACLDEGLEYRAIDDVAEWHEDFASEQAMSDYQNLIKELRQPFSTQTLRSMILYTAQPAGFANATKMHKGMFFTDSYSDAIGLAADRSGRQVFELRVPMRAVIQTKSGSTKWYQLVEDVPMTRTNPKRRKGRRK